MDGFPKIPPFPPLKKGGKGGFMSKGARGDFWNLASSCAQLHFQEMNLVFTLFFFSCLGEGSGSFSVASPPLNR